MKHIFLIAVLAFGLANLGNAQGTALAPQAQKWEYMVVTFDHPDTKQLNKLGEAFWELVAVVPKEVNGHTMEGGTYYFKRPLAL